MNYQVFNKLSSSIFLVSAKNNADINGFLFNNISLISTSPRLISFSCSKQHGFIDLIVASNAFAVSIVSSNADIAMVEKFSQPNLSGTEKFTGVNYWKKSTGAPIILTGSVGYFDCYLKTQLDLGSHWLVIGEIVEAEMIAKDEEPMEIKHYTDVLKLNQTADFFPFGDVPIAQISTAVEEDVYHCMECGYDYKASVGDAKGGIPAGVSLYDLPSDWKCPICSVTQMQFIVRKKKAARITK